MLRPLALALLLVAPTVLPASNGAGCRRASELERVVVVAGRTFAAVGSSIAEIDGGTGYCLGCHDGSVGRAVAEVPSPAPNWLPGQHASGHPVDVLYPVSGKDLRPLAHLDERLALEDGRVTCRTCHASDDGSELAMSNLRSALCLACHLK